MSYIDETWLRRAHHALKETLDVDQKTKQQMIQFLFDEGFWDVNSLTWDAAVARFNDNSNPTKAAFWKIGEVWALMLRFDRPQLLRAMAESTGYELRAIPTEERRQRLLQEANDRLVELQQQLAHTTAQIARLAEAPYERPLHALPGTRPAFSLPEEDAVNRLGCP